MKSQVPVFLDVPMFTLHEKFIGETCDNITEVGLLHYSGYQGMRNSPTSSWTQNLLKINSRTPGLRVKRLLTLRDTYTLWSIRMG